MTHTFTFLLDLNYYPNEHWVVMVMASNMQEALENFSNHSLVKEDLDSALDSLDEVHWIKSKGSSTSIILRDHIDYADTNEEKFKKLISLFEYKELHPKKPRK